MELWKGGGVGRGQGDCELFLLNGSRRWRMSGIAEEEDSGAFSSGSSFCG